MRRTLVDIRTINPLQSLALTSHSSLRNSSGAAKLTTWPLSPSFGLLIAIILTLWMAPIAIADSGRPSFDCNRASQPDEIAICQSPKLSQLDVLMAKGYKYARGQLGKARAEKLGRLYLKKRSACGYDVDCIAERQVEAIQAYQAVGAPISIPKQSDISTNENSYVIKGRCHMGGCGFTQVVSTNELASSPNGSLIEVTERDEYVEAPVVNDEPQWDKIRIPQFSGETYTGWAYCSTVLPAIIFPSSQGSGYLVDVLSPGFPETIFGVNTSSHLYYWGICHHQLIDESQLYDDNFNATARSLGYHRLGETQEKQYEFRTMAQVRSFLGL